MGRLHDLVLAGTVCFGRLGYRRTLMADVAREAGVATGSVYNYVDSKEALFHAVVCSGFDLPIGAPVTAPAFEATLEVIEQGLRRQAGTPCLKAALSSEGSDDVRAELSAVVGEQYDNISRIWPVLSVIEACAADLPPLEAMYFGKRRRANIDRLVRYLQLRAGDGLLRSFPDMSVAGQIVNEAVAWFAWKRHRSRDAERFDEAATKRTLLEFVDAALVL